MPFYGATYGGVSWNSFIDANNLSTGCYSADKRTAAVCNEEQAKSMGEGFWGNLPQNHDDAWYAEHMYHENVAGNRPPEDYWGWGGEGDGDTVGGGRYDSFFADPQNTSQPQETAMEIARRKNCVTPNSLVQLYQLELEAQWD